MEVMNIKGKKIGCVKDLIIDFNLKLVKGFVISSYKIFNKDISVYHEDIISFNSNMIIMDHKKHISLKLSTIKNMDVINKSGEIIGMVEDIIFNRENFTIKGIVVSTGFTRNFIYGKVIILLDNLILGEKNLYCFDENSKIRLLSVPHKLILEDDCNEKDI